MGIKRENMRKENWTVKYNGFQVLLLLLLFVCFLALVSRHWIAAINLKKIVKRVLKKCETLAFQVIPNSISAGSGGSADPDCRMAQHTSVAHSLGTALDCWMWIRDSHHLFSFLHNSRISERALQPFNSHQSDERQNFYQRDLRVFQVFHLNESVEWLETKT